ncbi:acyltransferase [Aquirufa echingensis]|uniref:Acyltransferase n=1 Tax=Aquirufa echingensis TaxID=3096516 RepID=A0ABW6D5C7_9BACT
MIKLIFLKFARHLIRFIKPLIRFIAEEADLVLYYPRLAIGQNQLLFKDSVKDISNNIPKSVYFNTRSGQISIGSNTVFGENVMVLTGKHNYLSNVENIEDLHQVPLSGRDIVIGDNCYIGSGAIIIGPVKIGDFAVIGAGAVVTKDVDSYLMVGGVPAKTVKKLTF